MWAFGVTFYFMLNLSYPFSNNSNMKNSISIIMKKKRQPNSPKQLKISVIPLQSKKQNLKKLQIAPQKWKISSNVCSKWTLKKDLALSKLDNTPFSQNNFQSSKHAQEYYINQDTQSLPAKSQKANFYKFHNPHEIKCTFAAESINHLNSSQRRRAHQEESKTNQIS